MRSGVMRGDASRLRFLPLLGLLGVSSITFGASAADSLATPITGRAVQELWPLEVTVSVVRIDDRGEPVTQAHAEGPSHDLPMPARQAVVPDGHKLRWSSTVQTPRGRRRFDLDVVARHHPEEVEIEWDLEVSDARFRPIGWDDYLLHRLRLGPELELGAEGLKIARSDIVTTRQGPFRHRVQIDGAVYEISIEAQTSRG